MSNAGRAFSLRGLGDATSLPIARTSGRPRIKIGLRPPLHQSGPFPYRPLLSPITLSPPFVHVSVQRTNQKPPPGNLQGKNFLFRRRRTGEGGRKKRRRRAAPVQRKAEEVATSMARSLHLSLAVLAVLAVASEAGFRDKFEVIGSGEYVRVDDDGNTQQVELKLDQSNGGSGFNSKDKYLYGEFSAQIKLIGGNSAGTVTSFYLTSGEGDGHDEIDIEFMGNLSGDPYVMNTNVWASGDGKKEHQFYLWFDPTADYHTYKIIWNPKNIIFQVDDVSVRTFKKYDDLPYPSSKPMMVHATLWDGSYWATRKGEVKIDWSQAPFVVNYRGYHADGCVNNGGASACPAGSDTWMNTELDAKQLGTVAWAEKNYMHYDYCTDGWRFPQGFPGECSRRN